MGSYLSEPQTSKKMDSGSNKILSFVSAEMQGWRKNMQDAVIHEIDLGDGNALFAVFDGHGGPEVSQFVKRIFVSILVNEPTYRNKQYVGALQETFRKVDQRIDSVEGAKQLRRIRNSTKTSSDGDSDQNVGNFTGCTANVVLITQNKIIVANAGDSRSVLCRAGSAFPLSIDHKPQDTDEQKRITRAGGTITMGRVNGGLNLSRSFGDFSYKRNGDFAYDQQMIICKPDIKEMNRQTEDQFILIGCDGIWERHVDDSQGLIDIVKNDIGNHKEQRRIVEDLLNLLLSKDTKEGIGCDNMSAIIVQFL